MKNLKFLVHQLSILISVNYSRIADPWPMFSCKTNRDYYQLFAHCIPDHPDTLTNEGNKFHYRVLSKLLRLMSPASSRNDVIENDIDIV